jgi:hypothetical protein
MPSYIDTLMGAINQLNPSDIYVDDISQGFTNAALGSYDENVNNARGYTQAAGDAGVYGYQRFNDILGRTAGQLEGMIPGYNNIANQYAQGAAAAQGLVNKGAGMELQNMTGMLGMYRRAANQDMPGQKILEQSLGANTNQALNRIREFGGSSQGVLGAVSNIYGGQQQQLREQALTNAQYRDQNQQNYMGAQERFGQRYGDVYNRMATAQEAATNMAQSAQERNLAAQQGIATAAGQLRSTGQEALTQAQSGASANMANFYSQLAPQTVNILTMLQQQRLAAEQQQADLRNRSILNAASLMGQGLQNQAQYQDQAWQMNQYNPYQNYMNYYNQYATQNVNTGDTQNALNNMSNMAYNQWANNQNANAQLWGAGANLVGNVASQWFMNRPGNNSAATPYIPMQQAQFQPITTPSISY